MDEAEDLWRAPDVVPKAWASVLGDGTAPAPSPAVRPPDAPLQPGDDEEDRREKRARSRKAFVAPVLVRKGWSQLDWASHAEVDHKTVGNYLKGARCYNDTRLKLAKALGITVDQLPQ